MSSLFTAGLLVLVLLFLTPLFYYLPIPVLAAPVPMLAAPIHARTAPPSVVDARSQTHAPAAPNPSAAHIASASNWLMSMLSEADNDSIMGLMQAKEYFQPTPGGPKAPPQV